MKTFLSFGCMFVAFFLAGCQNVERNTETSSEKSKIVEQDLDFRAALEKPGQVFLLGESHADKNVCRKSLKYGIHFIINMVFGICL